MNTTAAFLLALGIHEAAHYVTARALDVPVPAVNVYGLVLGKGVKASALGWQRFITIAVIMPRNVAPIQEALIAAAGPLANILTMWAMWRVDPNLFAASLVFAFASLLPFKGNDSMRVYQAIRRTFVTA